MKSKKIIVLMVVLLLIGGATTAFGLDLTVGGKGIVGHNFFSGKDYKDDLDDLNAKTEFRFGYSFGVFAVIGITPLIAIQPELMFSQFGGKFGASAEEFFGAGAPGDVSVIAYNNYLDVPVLVKLRFNRFSVFVGPNFLIKLGDGKGGLKATDDTVQDFIENVIEEDVQDLDSDALESFVIGGLVGVGYDHPLGPGVLMIDARYLLGLSSSTNPDSAQMMDTEYKQGSIKISVGYGYQLK